MKKRSIVKVLKTINEVCNSSPGCNLCVFKNSCPYSVKEMTDRDRIEIVASYIKNNIERGTKQ